MKVIVTGATGMVGKGVLLECLDHAEVREVLSIGRRPLGIQHPKLKELIHKDFSEFDSVAGQLEGYDACYACMGVSSVGMKEEEYTQKTYRYTIALATTLHRLNPQMTFTYVSGQGTDSTEKGRQTWARVKGKTENDLLKLGFRQAFMYRPGFIVPKRGVEPSSKFYRFMIKNLGWLLRLIQKMNPGSVVSTEQIGQSMIRVSLNGYNKKIINPADIHKLTAAG
ncbi:MAG: epimerase [Owenweeksia sp.]|nr:epimerase [Owenweeksia sp.]MBF98642.1 epimerase [Owenweeksia sp.]HBF21916.1 epimerase [Cryomorphaceae bacterium]HCQ16153.1 epimerase [Cryomorphaceae bacterium]